MESVIYKRLGLQPITQCAQYLDLISAIEQNPNLKIVQICSSDLYVGMFIVGSVDICIPTKGVYRGLDVRSKEDIIFYIPINYPLSAPSVMPAREDFPVNEIPHMNMSINGADIEELNLCLYRGDVNEWFFQSGVFAFCDRVVEWFSDLVNGELIHNDGFENVRINNQKSVLLMDYKALTDYIKQSKDNQGFDIFTIKSEGAFLKLTAKKYDFTEYSSNNIPCIFAFDRIMPEMDYTINRFNTFSDVEIFNSVAQVKKGIRRYRAQFIKHIDNVEKMPKVIRVVMAIKRPMQVLGTFDKFDYIAFGLHFDFERNPVDFGNCKISNYATLGLVNKELAEKISGTEFEKPEISVIGAGAIGSKVSMHLAKMGYTNQRIYDNDYLLPHNLIRHEEKYPCMIGFPKAFIAQSAIKALFNDAANGSVNNIDILQGDVNFDSDIVIDATASERCLNFLCNIDNTQNRVVRAEIFANGIVGATFVEGKQRKPDIYDLRVNLWYKAVSSGEIRQWLLSDKQEWNKEIFIGIGCSSDTFVLDDATISNHASVVPHIINKYTDCDDGAIVLNYFNARNLVENRIQIFKVKPFIIFDADGWFVHIQADVWTNIEKYLCDSMENMGIWFGAINHYLRRIVIVDTYIPVDNKRYAGEVTAGTLGVEEVIQKNEKLTNGLIKYVGEWHTHTGSSANPSRKDLIAFSQVEIGKLTLMTILGKEEVKNFILDRREVK